MDRTVDTTDARHSPCAPHDGLAPGERRAVVGAVLALHLAAGWGLLQVRDAREAVAVAAPLFVELIALPAPTPPIETPPVRLQAQPVTRAPTPPASRVTTAPAPAPAPTPAPAPAPAPLTAPPPEPSPPEPSAPPVVVAAPAPPAPPPPREIPAAAVQYLEPPAPVYPRLSRQLTEAGTVLVRVFVDADGLPRQVQVLQSSGFARLDEAATAAVAKARFRPYRENGQPVAGWARIPIPFELEN